VRDFIFSGRSTSYNGPINTILEGEKTGKGREDKGVQWRTASSQLDKNHDETAGRGRFEVRESEGLTMHPILGRASRTYHWKSGKLRVRASLSS